MRHPRPEQRPEIAENRAGPHRWRYRFRAKGVQTRAPGYGIVSRSPRLSRGLAGAARANDWLSQQLRKNRRAADPLAGSTARNGGVGEDFSFAAAASD